MMKLSINATEENYKCQHKKEETLMLRIVMLSVVMMNHILLSEEAPFFIQICIKSFVFSNCKNCLLYKIIRIGSFIPQRYFDDRHCKRQGIEFLDDTR
jgi:hypothetical protein